MTEKAKPARLTRRRFLKIAAGAACAAVGGGVLDALAIEPRWIKVTRPVVDLPALPAAWDGLRIAHLTDLHHGRAVSMDHVRKAVRLANAETPDLTVVTGDFVTAGRGVVAELSSVLAGLAAPLGVFAVLGNHDHWAGAAGVRAVVAAGGLKLIDNRHVVLRRAGSPLVLAGVGDLWEDWQDLAGALAGAPEGAPTLLLCHNPDYADLMPPAPRVDLMLSGHTHGGQVKVPFAGRPRLPIRNPRYAAGLARGPRCPVYTSRGIGLVSPAVRFNCRPELPVITLRRRNDVDADTSPPVR
jgi:predicted MPP superfamily phosphohydrolase